MVTLTKPAADQVKKLVQSNAEFEDKSLRIAVVGGGCSGHTYQMGFDIERDGDMKFESHGVEVIVDNGSHALVNGMEIDFVEELAGSSFVFTNPNAMGSCGCGSSFRA